MKVAITGANGFVGQNCHRSLKNAGYTVQPLQRPNFDLHDIEANRLKLEGVDVLVHCAATVHQMRMPKRKLKSLCRHVNVLGTQKLVQAANLAGVKHFIFLSTIKVLGEATHGRAFTERDTPNPQDSYAQSKLQAEQVITRQAEMPFTIIRPPLIYGPGMQGNMPRLIQQLKRPLPLPLGAIKNQRSLLHVFNLSRFIEQCCLNENAYNEVFVLCDDTFSTPQLCEYLKQQYGGKAPIISVPVSLLKMAAAATFKLPWFSRLTESLAIDNQKAKSTIHWQPHSLGVQI